MLAAEEVERLEYVVEEVAVDPTVRPFEST